MKIFQELLIFETMPEDWKTGLISKACHGDLSDCNNWRGVTLLSLTTKVFSKIMTAALEKDIRKQQAGFHKGRSCSDHIFTLKQILEQTREWNSTVYANFLDFEKAFDSIHRETLWCLLQHCGVEGVFQLELTIKPFGIPFTLLYWRHVVNVGFNRSFKISFFYFWLYKKQKGLWVREVVGFSQKKSCTGKHSDKSSVCQ